MVSEIHVIKSKGMHIDVRKQMTEEVRYDFRFLRDLEEEGRKEKYSTVVETGGRRGN